MIPSSEIIKNTINSNTILTHLNDVILIDDLEDYSVLFQPYTGETMGLNQTGLAIWRKIDGKSSMEEISVTISNKFDIPIEIISNDILEFCKKLYRRFFVVKDKSEQMTETNK